MILDDIRLLAGKLGLSLTVTWPVNNSVTTSEANVLLARIEKHLGMNPSSLHPLGMRYRICVERVRINFVPGDRVAVNTSIAGVYEGHEGVVDRLDHQSRGALVQLDNDKHGPRYFNFTSLRKVTTTMSIASRVATALNAFIATAKPTTVVAAVRELCAATAAASKADAAKKRAKKALVDLGITLAEYRPGTITAYEDKEFLVQAVTKEPASRLDQALLTAKLRDYGVSQARITAAFKAATVENKAATSIVVTEK